eukprot:scaffold1813_cov109-Cylindrotheca_fusiformis.AAC.2
METTLMGAAMKQQLVWENFEYKGELPGTLTKGERSSRLWKDRLHDALEAMPLGGPPTLTPKFFLMILFREHRTCGIFIINGKETQRLQRGLVTKEIDGFVCRILEDKHIPPFDLCIPDGARQTSAECRALMQSLNMYIEESERIQTVVYTLILSPKMTT